MLERTTAAWPLRDNVVHTVIGPDAGQHGPWSFITDAPGIVDMVGPPPVYLALAAWAA